MKVVIFVGRGDCDGSCKIREGMRKARRPPAAATGNAQAADDSCSVENVASTLLREPELKSPTNGCSETIVVTAGAAAAAQARLESISQPS